jgi:hypothetical protein
VVCRSLCRLSSQIQKGKNEMDFQTFTATETEPPEEPTKHTGMEYAECPSCGRNCATCGGSGLIPMPQSDAIAEQRRRETDERIARVRAQLAQEYDARFGTRRPDRGSALADPTGKQDQP